MEPETTDTTHQSSVLSAETPERPRSGEEPGRSTDPHPIRDGHFREDDRGR